jgi:hypothetical protein
VYTVFGTSEPPDAYAGMLRMQSSRIVSIIRTFFNRRFSYEGHFFAKTLLFFANNNEICCKPGRLSGFDLIVGRKSNDGERFAER